MEKGNLSIQKITYSIKFPTLEIGKMARDQEKENLSGKMEQNIRETLKMPLEIYLVSTPIQKKMQETTMKVIGRTT